jgi:hypothetical protein
MDTPEGTTKNSIDEFGKVELRVATGESSGTAPKADRFIDTED